MKGGLLLISLLLLAIGLSGCVGQSDATSFVKTLPEVQAFLAKNPDADIKAVFLDKEVVKTFIGNIRKDCSPQMQELPYWHMTITKGEEKVEVYLDETGQQALCIIKPATEQPKDECQTDAECNDNNIEQEYAECLTQKEALEANYIECDNQGKACDYQLQQCLIGGSPGGGNEQQEAIYTSISPNPLDLAKDFDSYLTVTVNNTTGSTATDVVVSVETEASDAITIFPGSRTIQTLGKDETRTLSPFAISPNTQAEIYSGSYILTVTTTINGQTFTKEITLELKTAGATSPPTTDSCLEVSCSVNKKCVSGSCMLKTCSEMEGSVCILPDLCDGTKYVTEDAGECCVGTCWDPTIKCGMEPNSPGEALDLVITECEIYEYPRSPASDAPLGYIGIKNIATSGLIVTNCVGGGAFAANMEQSCPFAVASGEEFQLKPQPTEQAGDYIGREAMSYIELHYIDYFGVEKTQRVVISGQITIIW